MNVVVSSRHNDASAALDEYAREKALKLTRYYDRIQEIEVVFDAENHDQLVEMIVNAEHNDMFIAKEKGDDVYKCVDGCISKLERQLRDHKEKHRNRKHAVGDARQFKQNSPDAAS